MTQKAVLLVGKDHILVRSRMLILQRLGHRMLWTEDDDEAKRLLQVERIDIVILCHTIADVERDEVLRMAQTANPSVRCLWLLEQCGEGAPDGTTGYCMIEGPERFVQHVKALSI